MGKNSLTPEHANLRWSPQLNKTCKLYRLYANIKRDRLNPHTGFGADLTTSVEEAADHFAVGAAITITRFFFVCFPMRVAE